MASSPPGIPIDIQKNIPIENGYGPIYYGSADQIKLTKVEDPHGFDKFTHTKTGIGNGGSFRVDKVIFGANNKKDIATDIGLSPTENIKHLVVWYWFGDTSMDKPLMVELANIDGTYTYKSSKDNWKSWNDTQENNKLEGDKLEQTLDELNFYNNNAVAIDLTKTDVEQHSKGKNGGDNTYCCKHHEADSDKRVTVTPGGITVYNVPMTEYYQHSLNTDTKVAAIKYYGSANNRKRITASKLNFPMSVYAFYSSKGRPVLLYLDDGGKNDVNGWYGTRKKRDKNWKKINRLKNVTPDNFSNLTCKQWIKLKNILNQLGCSIVATCSNQEPEDSEEGQFWDNEEEAKGEEGEEESEEETTAAQSQVSPEARASVSGGPGTSRETHGLGSSPGPNGSNSFWIKTTISVTTGILGTSALACFAGWKLYNRSKGDPWVRQI